MALIISSILGEVKIQGYDEIQKGIYDVTAKTPYQHEIVKSYATGILTGYADKTFKPGRTLSRAEAATVIHRLVDESMRVKPEVGGVVKEKPPLSQVVKNYKSFIMDDGITVDNELAKAETYEIVSGSDGGLYITEGFYGARALRIPVDSEIYIGRKYLIKDNMVVELLFSITKRGEEGYADITDIDIESVDYIAALNSETLHLTLLPNPFKR